MSEPESAPRTLPDSLPSSWRMVSLGQVAEVNPRDARLVRDDDAPTTFVPMVAVDGESGTITDALLRPYAEVRRGYTRFAEGDVLFAKISPCMQNGKHAVARGLVDGVGFGTTEFHVIRPGADVLPEWVHLYVRQPSVLRSAESLFFGSVGQQRLPASFLEHLRIPLPPLPEQMRIAAALREQLDAAARMRAAAEVQVDALQVLVATRLEGLLSGTSARSCRARRCGEVARVTGGIQKSPSRAPRSFHRPFLTVRNVQRGYLDLTTVEDMEITPAELERCRLRRGDLLVVEGNGSREQIGRNALFGGEIDECIHQNHVIRVRVDRCQLNPEFLSLYLNSRDGMAQMVQRAMTTTGLYTLSVKKIESLEIPMPSLSGQTALVARWVGQQRLLDGASQAQDQQAAEIGRLPAAFLRRAFSGDL